MTDAMCYAFYYHRVCFIMASIMVPAHLVCLSILSLIVIVA